MSEICLALMEIITSSCLYIDAENVFLGEVTSRIVEARSLGERRLRKQDSRWKKLSVVLYSNTRLLFTELAVYFKITNRGRFESSQHRDILNIGVPVILT